MTDLANIAASNSLADLAFRINAEHEAASTFMQQGLERAIRAGELLIEAKDQVPHGQWLSWLKDNCPAISTRTVQAYMRVTRSFGKLDDKYATRVAHLSFRDALNSLAVAGTIAMDMAPASVELALERFEHDQTQTWVRSVRHVRMEEKHARNRGSLDTPSSMLPSPEGRKIRVARNPAQRKWLLAIGPSITRAALIEKEEAARASPVVQELQQDQGELLDRAARRSKPRPRRYAKTRSLFRAKSALKS